MINGLRAVALCFAAGAAGGLLLCVAAWLSARYGITRDLGANVASALVPAVIYPRVVLGGLWAQLFLLPLARHWLVRGFIIGAVVTLVQLVILPLLLGRGPSLLSGTALLWLLLNLTWGIGTAGMLRLLRG